MRRLRYNLMLFWANTLFALNFSLFVTTMESESLSIGAIFLLQNLLMLCFVALWRWLLPHGEVRITTKDKILLSLISLLNALGWGYAMLWGMSLTSPIDAATIASAGPSLTLIFAHFMRRRRLTAVRLSGVAISLLAVALLVAGRWGEMVGGEPGRGNMLLLCAVVVAALNTLLLKPFLQRYGMQSVAWCYALSSAVVSLPLFAHQVDIASLWALGGAELAECTMLLLLGSALPLLMLFEGTEFLSPLHTSLYRYVQPFVTSLVVVARGQTTLSWANYAALGAIVIGCALVARGVGRSD